MREVKKEVAGSKHKLLLSGTHHRGAGQSREGGIVLNEQGERD